MSLVNGHLARKLMKLDMLQNGRVMSEYRQDVVLQDRSDLHARRIRAMNRSLVALGHFYNEESLFL